MTLIDDQKTGYNILSIRLLLLTRIETALLEVLLTNLIKIASECIQFTLIAFLNVFIRLIEI